MEQNKLLENINNKTLPDKLIIVDQFKSKIVDYIESDLIFQDEKTLEEDLEQIGLTFVEYKKYSQDLSKVIYFSKIEKINNLNDYVEFINVIKEIPSFLDGIDIVEETMEKHLIKDLQKVLDLELKIDNQNEYINLLSSIHSCKDYLKDSYDKIVSYVITKYIAPKTQVGIALGNSTESKTNINLIEKVEQRLTSIPSTKEEPKKDKKSDSIVDIFKELIEEELSQKEQNKEIINKLYVTYSLKKGTPVECKITKIDERFLYLELLDDNNEENLIIKKRKIPLHNYRVGAKEKGYVSEINKTEDEVEVILVTSLQSIDANEIKETKKKKSKSKSAKTAKAEGPGAYSEKYFKDLFNKMKTELGITMCNVKKCTYDSNYGALVIIDNKKKNSSEEIKFVESLMNKKCGEDIVKIIEFKYDAIEFLSHVFEVDQCDVIKGTGKYIVVNYDTNMTPWFTFISNQIQSMVNYKVEF